MSTANDNLQQEIDKILSGRENLTVLEAGCGSTSHIRIPQKGKLVGIDISEKQLARNEQLDEKIHGDLQTHKLEKQKFDVIVSWDVLEHLDQPALALGNLFESTAKDGIVIIAAPNFFSIKGIVAKFLPHFLQVAFYRHIIGDKRAGIDDQGPFKTFLRRGMWPEKVVELAKNSGLSLLYLYTYEGPVPTHLRQKHKFVDLLFKIVGGVSRALLGNNRDLTHSDYMLILQRR